MNASRSIAVLDFDSAKIRVTPDGRVSVIDALTGCGISKPRDAWKVIKSKLSTELDGYRFPGKGQQNTPVADKEQLMQVLMLSPKAAKTDKFREWAASILVRYLEGDVALAEEIFERTQESPKKQAHSAARINGIVSRNYLTATLQGRGTHQIYGTCTNATYQGLFETNANGLRKQMELTTKDNPRDHMELGAILALSLAEWKASQKIDQENVRGDQSCATVCQQSAQQVRSIL